MARRFAAGSYRATLMPRGTDEHLSSGVEHLQRAFPVDVITAVAVAKVTPTMPAARPIAVRRP